MATAYEAVTVQGEGITLSLLVWRKFKRPMLGMVERILDSQGRLSKQYLEVGDVVYIPIETEKPKRPTVSLWD